MYSVYYIEQIELKLFIKVYNSFLEIGSRTAIGIAINFYLLIWLVLFALHLKYAKKKVGQKK